MARVSTTMDKFTEKMKGMASHMPEEGEMTRRIEQQTAKIPSVGFLGMAVGSIVASAALAFIANKKDMANFVGMWAPTLLLIGVYNKLVKLEGSDWRERH